MEVKCNYCGSTQVRKKGITGNGSYRYFCDNPECEHKTFTAGGNVTIKAKKAKIGMSVQDFREKFDVEFIVEKTLAALDREVIYEKSDIYKLTGLRAGFPGLAATLEDKKFQEYKGRVGGRDYFSHPDTIKELTETAILQ